MIDSSSGRDAVELLADEFATRCRNGESPSVFEYVTSTRSMRNRSSSCSPHWRRWSSSARWRRVYGDRLRRAGLDVPDRLAISTRGKLDVAVCRSHRLRIEPVARATPNVA